MAEYLRYVIHNTEPFRIADDSRAQSNQTRTLRYIPGTTIRGYVVNELAKREDFEEIKKVLFSRKVRFLNAYLSVGGRELIPSPKSFYEDKTISEGRKKVENLVKDGTFSEGLKRASLGQYCYFEDDCIHYYSVETDSDMKIKINVPDGEKKNVFRHEYITKDHDFTGYIAICQPELKDLIKAVFEKKRVTLGNARSAGFGKCEVEIQETDTLPYEEYLPDHDLEDSCYMMMLSGTAMRNEYGEICGIDWGTLSDRLGVQIDTEDVICSTSTVDVRGYNRMWKGKIPSAVMYDQGSIFHLSFKGKLTRETMRKICDEGIGIRTNEGFGRVLFIRDYEKLSYKLAEKEKRKKKAVDWQAEEDGKTIRVIAKTYYYNQIRHAMSRYVLKVNEKSSFWKGDISNSKLGTIQALATAYRYDPEKGMAAIRNYFSHETKKEKKNNTQKERSSIVSIRSFVEGILGKDLEDILEMEKKDRIMGVPRQELLSGTERDRIKLMLIVSVIRYNYKGVD